MAQELADGGSYPTRRRPGPCWSLSVERGEGYRPPQTSPDASIAIESRPWPPLHRSYPL